LRRRQLSPKASKRSCMGLPAALIVPASRNALPPKAASDGDNVRLHVLTDGGFGSVGARAQGEGSRGALGRGGDRGHVRRGPWAERIGPLGGISETQPTYQSRRESANQHRISHCPKEIELESQKDLNPRTLLPKETMRSPARSCTLNLSQQLLRLAKPLLHSPISTTTVRTGLKHDVSRG
jgi:hypothetical protein